MVSAAHIHRAEFKDPKSQLFPHTNVPYLIGRSVSPDYENNPSYNVIKFSENSSFEEVELFSLQL